MARGRFIDEGKVDDRNNSSQRHAICGPFSSITACARSPFLHGDKSSLVLMSFALKYCGRSLVIQSRRPIDRVLRDRYVRSTNLRARQFTAAHVLRDLMEKRLTPRITVVFTGQVRL